MSERTITCSHCNRQNRVPERLLVEASCGRCESALTWYTWVAPAVHGGALTRGILSLGAAALLALLLGPPLVEWLETEPFRLNDRPRAEGSLSVLSDELAGETSLDEDLPAQ